MNVCLYAFSFFQKTMAETKMKQMMKNFSFSKNENLMINKQLLNTYCPIS